MSVRPLVGLSVCHNIRNFLIAYRNTFFIKTEPALNILYNCMVELTYQPGRFDSIARQLTQDLNVVIKGGYLARDIWL